MKYYKGASTNKNIGGRTHGGFGNSGQKKGNNGAMSKIGSQKGNKYAKESLGKTDPVQVKLRKISKSMFGRRKSLNGDVAQRAQLNG